MLSLIALHAWRFEAGRGIRRRAIAAYGIRAYFMLGGQAHHPAFVSISMYPFVWVLRWIRFCPNRSPEKRPESAAA